MTSSMATHSWTYDVFLSFRGEDTRYNFTAHLHDALRRNGINTFMDDKLRSGDEISPALVKAIEESEISIIVFSKNYASSKWCLDELTKILECKKPKGQRVLPVFYNINPSEVRHQTNSVGEAFTKHEKRFKDDQMNVQRWKTVLIEATNLSGKHLGKRNEPEFIQEIIEWVNSILEKKTRFQVAQYPVGIESRVQVLKSLLDIKKNDSTCMVGIFGTGGIGKTTLAKAIYNVIAPQFESSCFLENIRETSNQIDGLIRLQNKLLSKFLGDSNLMVDNIDQGITLIKHRLHSLRLLLVLDDVDQLVQLEKLVGKGDWFGLGSRIIVTTRDKHLLTAQGVVSVYQVNKLDHNEALKLFSRYTFNKDIPDDDYVDVTKDAIRYCGGLPLALTVLGSTLKDKDILYWKSKLEEYKRIPNDDILKKLRISWDVLDENAKNIFLDMACFFKGENVEHVTKMLDSFGFHSYSGIKELKDKCLITQSFGSLVMHDLLQEMGREIVRQESPKEPGERNRLWFHEDVRYILEGNTGTNKVEGILINLPEPDLIHLSPKAFKKMKRLRMFINHNACFLEEPNFLSNELKVLDWPNYPGESLPANFCGKNLVVLTMPQIHFKELEGVQNFQNMKIMNFSFCEFLRKIPDVSRIPNLEILTLDYCENLVEVHHSVGFLNKLVSLRLGACSNLKSFPRSLKMRSLKLLCLRDCSRLKNFPEIECQMECLENIDLRGAGVEELPSSIGYLTGVKTLNLNGCTHLMDLPYSIHKWQHLEILSIGEMDRIILPCLGLSCSNYQLCHLQHLSLSGCSKVTEFLEMVKDTIQSMPTVVSIEEYEISSVPDLLQYSPSTNTSDSNDGYFLVAFPKLRVLDLKNCVLSESNFFRTFVCCSTLTDLDLSRSDIVTLPPCIRRFVRLKALYLNGCKALKEILGLPPNVKRVEASGCVSLAIFLEEDKRSQFQVPALILGDNVLTESNLLIQRECPLNLEYLDLSSSAIVSLPRWFNKFVGLEILRLISCKQLREIPILPPNIKRVQAKGCTSLERFQCNNINDLPMLQWIDFSNCLGLRENMGDDLQIRLRSEGHLRDREFDCIFLGNTIPHRFSRYVKEISNTDWGEIDFNGPLHLDGKNTRFSFSVVIGTEDGQEKDPLRISVEVINNGQHIYYHEFRFICNSAGSNDVWLNFHHSHQSQLKTDNLRVEFSCDNPSKSVFFKSYGFHIEHMKRKR